MDEFEEDVAKVKTELEQYLDPYLFSGIYMSWVVGTALERIAEEEYDRGTQYANEADEEQEVEEQFNFIIGQLDGRGTE